MLEEPGKALFLRLRTKECSRRRKAEADHALSAFKQSEGPPKDSGDSCALPQTWKSV